MHELTKRVSGRLPGDGLELAYDSYGSAGGRPVIFLHGGGQTRGSWRNAGQAAAALGFHSILLDLRGHGDSQRSSAKDYRLENFTADLRRIVTGLSQPPVLIGASLGGLISLLYAGTGGAAVGLVLVDVTPQLNAVGVAEIGAFMRAHPEGFAAIEDAANAVAAYLPQRPRPRDHSGLLRNLRRGSDGRYRWHWDPEFLNGEMLSDVHAMKARLEAAARALTIPVLLVRGGQSRVVTLENVQTFLALVPHAKFVDVAGADHMVAGDQNDAFNRAVGAFLDDFRTG
jgi:pimeloyl-ACP methyl ester carboxylesterase